jgi:hypothetical protein
MPKTKEVHKEYGACQNDIEDSLKRLSLAKRDNLSIEINY